LRSWRRTVLANVGPLVPRRGNQAFADGLLASELAGPANGLILFAGGLFRRLLIAATTFHLPEYALALHFSFQGAKRLVDIVVAYKYLQKIGSLSVLLSWNFVAARYGIAVNDRLGRIRGVAGQTPSCAAIAIVAGLDWRLRIQPTPPAPLN
jgi:hypothetical protein